jgi:hypothetical protein
MMGGIGQMLFGIIFNSLLMFLFAPKPKDTISYGPRLDNLKPAVKDIQGQVINLTYGTTRVSGSIFWASDIRETEHRTETEQGGKGGGSATHTDVTYTYDCDLAVGICEGEILGIRKIWANKEVLYNIDVNPNTISWLKFDLYTGSEDQVPDATLQANLGMDLTTAHRGLAYIVFREFQLDPFGRRVPQAIEFEVVAKGVATSSAFRYTQFNYANWQEYGNDGFTADSHSYMFLDPYTFVVGNIMSNTGIEFATINVPTSSVTKYNFPCITSNWVREHNGWNTWCGEADQVINYVFPYVTFLGVQYRRVPVLLRSGDVNTTGGAVPQYGSAYTTYNLINKKRMELLVGPDYGGGNSCVLGGRFVFHQGRIGFNATNACWGTGFHIFADFFEHYKIPASSVNMVDNYGFNDLTLNTIIYKGGLTTEWKDGHTWIEETAISTVNIGNDLPVNDLRFALVGFPTDETISCKTLTGEGDYYLDTDYYYVINRSFDILSVDDRLSYVDYQACEFSVHDHLEKDLAVRVEIEKTEVTRQYRCIDSSLVGTTTVTTTGHYPAHFTTFEPYHRHKNLPEEGFEGMTSANNYGHIVVYYIEDELEPNFDINSSKWLRLKDGTEYLFWSLATQHIKVYKKESYYEYSRPTTFEEYVAWINNPDFDHYDYATGWLDYNETNSITTSREIRPYRGCWYTEGGFSRSATSDYPYESSVGYKYRFGESKLAFTTTSFKLQTDISMVLTAPKYIWTGGNVVNIKSGTSLYKYYLNTGELKFDMTSPVYFSGFYPTGDTYIVTDLHRTGYPPYPGSSANVYYLNKVVNGIPAKLGAIIEDISTKADIDLSILDISSEAYNIDVYGYNISDDIKLIDALDVLLMNYFVDAFESEWRIKFRTRKEYLSSQANLTTIGSNSLGVKYIDEKYNEKYKIIIREDIELPQSLNYTYIAAEKGFIQSNVIAIRNIDYNIGIKATVKCPIALTTNEAYSNAFRLLFDVWRSVREYEFRLPKNYSFIEPGDIVLLPIGSSTNTNEYQVVKISEVVAESHAYIELKGIDEDARNLEGLIIDGAYEQEVNTLMATSVTKGDILDIRPLCNKFYNINYSDPGVYYYTYGENMLWRGGALLVSEDNVTYSKVDNFGPFGASAGTVLSATNYGLVTNDFMDGLNSIIISVDSYEDFYSNSDEDIIYKEGNLLAIKSSTTGEVEFLQFFNIIEDGETSNIITLNKFNRGLYNTNQITINPGDKVVLLIPVGFKKLPIPTIRYDTYTYYRLVSLSQSPDAADTYNFKYLCNWYKPYNICNSLATLSGSDISITWNNRERNKPTIFLGDPEIIDALNFKIEVYNYTGTLVRTITDVLENSYTYTSSMITADGLTSTGYIRFRIIRKATFLEFNHDVYDDIIYNPKTYLNKIQDISSSLILYKEFSSEISTNIIPDYDKNTSIVGTYNNYNGLNRPYIGYTANKYESLNSVRYKWGDKITFSGVSTNYSEYPSTVVALIKLDGDISSSYVQESAIIQHHTTSTLSVGNGQQLTFEIVSSVKRLNIRLGGKGTMTLSNVQFGKWYFVSMSNYQVYNACCSTGYIRALDDSAFTSAAYSGYGGNASTTYTTIGFTQSTGDISDLYNIDIQELLVFDRNLYIESGYNFNKIEQLYNEVKNKWLPQ